MQTYFSSLDQKYIIIITSLRSLRAWTRHFITPKRKSPAKKQAKVETIYLPRDIGKNRFTYIFFEDILTNLDDFKRKEMEREGFERALKNIGLN